MARYMLMKLRPYEGQNLFSGMYLSEKLDGIRCLWDGGATRGRLKRTVPWANVVKEDRYVNEQTCSGLWTQYGNVIQAPDWFLDKLPPALLEGELFAGRGGFQTVTSAVKKLVPIDSEWEAIRFVAFDAPSIHRLFAPGKVSMHSNTAVVWKGCLPYFTEYGDGIHRIEQDIPYEVRRRFVARHANDVIEEKEIRRVTEMMDFFREVVAAGGEGVVVKARENIWHTDRAKDAFKYKPRHTAEAVVTGFTEGKGKYEGMIGALVCDFNGVRLELSGLTDVERHWDSCPIKIGDTVEFEYRELTNDGVPKEAAYKRVRNDQ